MKQALILLLALGNLVMGAAATNKKTASNNDFWDDIVACFVPQEVILDTKLITADKRVSSLYAHPEHSPESRQYASSTGRESSVSFYVDVDKMLGGKKLRKGSTYKLQSISWIGHPTGDFSGGGRMVTVSNGEDAMIRPLPETKKNKITIHQKGDNADFSFSRDDILEVSISWKGDGYRGCTVRYFDAPPKPAVIRGTALNLTPEGTLPEGVGPDNKVYPYWRFNSPAVRIRAISEPSYDGKTITCCVLGLVVLLLLIKLLAASKKNA